VYKYHQKISEDIGRKFTGNRFQISVPKDLSPRR